MMKAVVPHIPDLRGLGFAAAASQAKYGQGNHAAPCKPRRQASLPKKCLSYLKGMTSYVHQTTF